MENTTSFTSLPLTKMSSSHKKKLDLENMWNIKNEYILILMLINTLEEGNHEIFNSSAEAMAIYDAGHYFASCLSCFMS